MVSALLRTESGSMCSAMGPNVTTKTDLPAIPAVLADVALIDGPTCAAASGISLSAWSDLVRVGAAPHPVIRRPRCTRWRLADIRAWLIQRANQSGDERSDALVAQAKRASNAAKAKRAGSTTGGLR